MAAIVQVKNPNKNITQPGKYVEKWNICLLNYYTSYVLIKLWKQSATNESDRIMIQFCDTEMAWTDLLRQLGNFKLGTRLM